MARRESGQQGIGPSSGAQPKRASDKAALAAAEPREAALTQAEHDMAGFQKTAKLAADEADTRTQAQKFEDAARELGTDQDEDRFKDVLRTLAKPKA